MRFNLLMAAVLALLPLAGCVSAPASSTSVDITASGAANMNGGAPAKVKVYYLTATGTFSSSDFFALFNKPEATLGTDLVAVDELQLAPGRTVTNSRNFAGPAPTAVGVVAAFRDIDGARFLAVRNIAPDKANRLQVVVSGNSISIR